MMIKGGRVEGLLSSHVDTWKLGRLQAKFGLSASERSFSQRVFTEGVIWYERIHKYHWNRDRFWRTLRTRLENRTGTMFSATADFAQSNTGRRHGCKKVPRGVFRDLENTRYGTRELSRLPRVTESLTGGRLPWNTPFWDRHRAGIHSTDSLFYPFLFPYLLFIGTDGKTHDNATYFWREGDSSKMRQDIPKDEKKNQRLLRNLTRHIPAA